ncbi:MAG TPA: hypothetical protein VLJ38_21250, partial [Polyangiaceae bacterium]|nr:hypothetical protein [Polyangiaceae bacterium]
MNGASEAAIESAPSVAARALERLGVPATAGGFALGSRFASGRGPSLAVRSPIDGSTLRELGTASPAEV